VNKTLFCNDCLNDATIKPKVRAKPKQTTKTTATAKQQKSENSSDVLFVCLGGPCGPYNRMNVVHTVAASIFDPILLYICKSKMNLSLNGKNKMI